MSGKVPAQNALLTAGRYRVERLIARGGMGAVYLARHIDLHRQVALKILSPSQDMEESGAFEERFRLEAETLAALNHPNIVTLYDYGETDDGRYFLALEYIDGPRFTDRLRPGPLEPSDAVRLILQVCRALRYAHRRGVVHRDLKPSNLLTWRDDEGEEHVKVVDFGLVKVMEDDQSLTRAGLILGSPHCMAPEQIRGDEIDHRADIYSIGILLYRAVTGVWPFHGDSSTATMIAHINNAVPRMADLALAREVPPLLESTIRRCLGKRPDDRYADIGGLMTDLERAVSVDASLTLSGGSQGVPERTQDHPRSSSVTGGTVLSPEDEPTGLTNLVPDPSGLTAPLPQLVPDARPAPATRAPALWLALLALLIVLAGVTGGVVSWMMQGPGLDQNDSTLGRSTDALEHDGAPDGPGEGAAETVAAPGEPEEGAATLPAPAPSRPPARPTPVARPTPSPARPVAGAPVAPAPVEPTPAAPDNDVGDAAGGADGFLGWEEGDNE
jgi:eukaryotic-like serine/threonine-protein kinase